MYGKRTQCAVASLSLLAEVHDDGVRLSASAIADARGLPRPLVAKMLSILANAGLVDGMPGPHGGFRLARDPSAITIHDVFRVFERDERRESCPVGGGVCGGDDPCPLHERLTGAQRAMDRLLHETTFAVFRTAHSRDKPRWAFRGSK
jgi:Rrf2 family protein